MDKSADAPQRRLILASASPRRQALLREAGYEFVVHPANVDEDAIGQGLLPVEHAQRLASAKADAVARQFHQDVILAADTLVAFGDRMLGKPADANAARAMLELLSGTTHIVITGVSVVCLAGNVRHIAKSMSAVRMRELTDKQTEEYVLSGEWSGKAGGYGIQDPDPFVTRISGSHSNIVGLPMRLTKSLLALAGVLPGTSLPGEPR